jgi:hypothetical protein
MGGSDQVARLYFSTFDDLLREYLEVSNFINSGLGAEMNAPNFAISEIIQLSV